MSDVSAKVRSPLLARLIATVGYTGFFPWAPATLASAIVSVVYFFLPPMAGWVEAVLLAGIAWIAIVTSTVVEMELGLDAHPIVIDEVAGMIVAYFWIPLPEAWLPRVLMLFVGFAFFRVFDIVKPWPADKLQHLRGGMGIVADDLMAGLYANLALRLVVFTGLLSRIAGP